MSVRILAIYIDFLIVLAAIGVLIWAVAPIEFTSVFIPLGAAVAIALLLRKFDLSPGSWITAPIGVAIEASPRPPRLWANCILGGLLFLEGTKSLVRWIEMERPLPIFGIVPEGDLQIVVSVVFGAVFIVAGVLILRLRDLGRYMTIGVGILGFLSILASWGRMSEVVERMVIARREAQGFPIRDGEIAFMQGVVPGAWLIGAVIVVALAYLCYGRPLGGRFTNMR